MMKEDEAVEQIRNQEKLIMELKKENYELRKKMIELNSQEEPGIKRRKYEVTEKPIIRKIYYFDDKVMESSKRNLIYISYQNMTIEIQTLKLQRKITRLLNKRIRN